MDLSDDQGGNVALEKSLKVVVDSESSSLHVPAKRRAAVTEETETNAESIEQKEKKIKPNEPSSSSVVDEQSLSLNFEDILPRLQRNDPRTIEVKATADYNFPTGYGRMLGEALLHNTMVTKLEMNLALFLPMSVRSDETKAEPEIQWLLRYLSNNESLVLFAAMGGYLHPKERMSQLIFESVLTCKRLESLKWYIFYCPMALHRLLSESRSLQELDLAFASPWWVSHTDERVQHIEAVMPSTRLRKLVLLGCGQEPMHQAIVRGLSAPDTLRELRLKFSNRSDRDNLDSCVDALSEYLRSARTLERLELENYDMNTAKMTQVLSVLTHPPDTDGASSGLYHAVPKVFLSSLSFRGCNFHERSDQVLVDFFQTRATGDNGEIILQSNLRELHVSLSTRDWTGLIHALRGVMGSQLSRNLADSILTQEGQQGKQPADSQNAVTGTMPTAVTAVPTIGSQLETLSLRFVGPEFFDHLRANAARVPSLQSLELVGAGPDTCEAFANCAPFLKTIRTLNVSNCPRYYRVCAGSKQFLATGIWHSASICHFPIRIGGQDGQKIDAYCQRNMELGKLLALEPPPPPPRPTDGNNGHIPGDESFNAGTTITADQSLRPSLIQAAAPMPQESRVTLVSRCLFALGQGIGSSRPTTQS